MPKLLLTSDGLTNDSIRKAFYSLLPEDFANIGVAYIPTAANITPHPKGWSIRSMAVYEAMFPNIDIIDLSTLRRADWEPRLAAAQLLVLGGGNPFYLHYWLRKSGLAELLTSEWASDKSIVGISAGSMVLGSLLPIDPEPESLPYLLRGIPSGLGLVDFGILPHLDGEHSGTTTMQAAIAAKYFGTEVYSLDDDSALLCENGKIEVVSEGQWKKIAPQTVRVNGQLTSMGV